MASRRAAPHSAAHGAHAAAALSPDRTEEALAEFRRLNTREARAAFADYWIGIWAQDFEFAWPMVYELLNLVNEEELFKDPRRVGPAAPGDPGAHGDKGSYGSFAEYFEDRAKRPFERWAELESTYKYVRDFAPGLLTATLADAQKARTNAIREADDIPLPAHGEIGNGRESRPDNISSTFGTSESYLRRRLKRDFPDLFVRVDRQELSARSAAIQAGIVKRTQSVRLDDPESAAQTLRKHMDRAALRRLASRLAELLAEEDGPQ